MKLRPCKTDRDAFEALSVMNWPHLGVYDEIERPVLKSAVDFFSGCAAVEKDLDISSEYSWLVQVLKTKIELQDTRLHALTADIPIFLQHQAD